MIRFFSIIMPVYNAEKYIKKSIDSILAQTYGNFELILVDDGSTDTSAYICDTYADKDERIKVIHQKNGGQTIARKSALKHAVGKYIVCVDSDDWVDENYLYIMHKVIKDYCVDIVCCGMIQVGKTTSVKKILPYKKGLYKKDDLKKYIYPILIQPAYGEGFTPSVWGKAIKREIYDQCQENVDDRLKMGEDLACSLPCIYAAESMYVLENCLYFYRYNPASYTHGNNVLLWDGPKLILGCISKIIDKKLFDFENQMYRRGVRELFLVVNSQFNRKESYLIIKKDILYHINEETNANMIKNAHFKVGISKSSIRYLFYQFALKYKVIWMIKLYHAYIRR